LILNAAVNRCDRRHYVSNSNIMAFMVYLTDGDVVTAAATYLGVTSNLVK